MTVEELITTLGEFAYEREVLVVDGMGGWMTPVALKDDEDRVIMRLEPALP